MTRAIIALLAIGMARASTLPTNISEAVGQSDDALFTSADYAQATDWGVDEFAFRLNEGNVARHTLQRLDSFVDAVVGKRITYAEMTA